MSEKEQRNLIPRPDVTTPVLAWLTKVRGGKPVSDMWRRQWHIHTYVIPRLIRGFWFLFNRKMLRRYAFTFACLATLLALAYAIEDWRGKNAWLRYKKDLMAKGIVMDWDTYVSQNPQLKVLTNEKDRLLVNNVFALSIPQTNTVRLSISTYPNRQLAAFKNHPPDYEAIAALPEHGTNEISIENLRALGGENNAVDIRKHLWKDPQSSLNELAAQSGLNLDNNSKSLLSYFAPWLREEMLPDWENLGSLEVMAKLLKMQGAGAGASLSAGKVQVRLDVSKATLREWCRVNRPWMENLTRALRSPGNKLDIQFDAPLIKVRHNFVAIRTLAQSFTLGAQLALADKRMDDVWFYLDGLESMMSFMAEPPHVILSTMIEETIAEQYMEVLETGLRLRAFSRTDLLRIRSILSGINLVQHFKRAGNGWERLNQIYNFEHLQRSSWVKAFDPDPHRDLIGFNSGPKGWLGFAMRVAPEGWYYQNLLRIQRETETLDGALDSEHRTVNSQTIAEFYELWKKEKGVYPGSYSILKRLVTADYESSFQILAINQSRLHILTIATALEEYRLAHDSYPVKLEGLMPKYLIEIPNDVIDGQPMRYRLEAKDSFVLYSVGWNRKDEGGAIKVTDYLVNPPKLGFTFYSKNRTHGDWVFRSKPLPNQ